MRQGSTIDSPKSHQRLLFFAAVAALVIACVVLGVILTAGGGGTGSTPPPLDAAAAQAAGSLPQGPLTTGSVSRQGVDTTEPSWYAKQKLAEARQKAFESTLPPSPATSVASSTTTATPVAARTAQVGTNGSTPLRGVWSGTAQRLADYLLAESPHPSFSVPVLTLAELYVRYAAEVGLRADLLWAQMLHETGFGRYGGDVLPEQNNFAGIGATGGGEAGSSFPTAEDGVKAHIAHMVAYVFTQDMAPWTNSSVDPRYSSVRERGVVRVLSDLDGRWAVPGTGYGAAIERHVAAINS